MALVKLLLWTSSKLCFGDCQLEYHSLYWKKSIEEQVSFDSALACCFPTVLGHPNHHCPSLDTMLQYVLQLKCLFGVSVCFSAKGLYHML